MVGIAEGRVTRHHDTGSRASAWHWPWARKAA